MKNKSRNFGLFIFVLALLAASLCAQQVEIENVPDKVLTVLSIGPLSKVYVVSGRLNPFYLRGDFDGDGKQDYAVWIVARKNQATGIAFLLSSQKRVIVLGAGNPFKLAMTTVTNLDFINIWKVYGKGPVERGVQADRPPSLVGEAIVLGKRESASGLIYWTGKKFNWYQQGD